MLNAMMVMPIIVSEIDMCLAIDDVPRLISSLPVRSRNASRKSNNVMVRFSAGFRFPSRPAIVGEKL